MKKIILSLCLSLFPVLIFSQGNTFVISGTIGSYSAPAKVYLLSSSGRFAIDSVMLKNGSFEMTGQVDQLKKALLLFDSKGVGLSDLKKISTPDQLEIYLEKGKLELSSKDSIHNAVIIGSELNTDYQNYSKQVAPHILALNILKQELKNAPKEKKASPEFQDDFIRRYDSISKEIEKVQINFVQSHPSSRLSLELLKEMSRYSMNVSVVKPLYNSLSDNIRNSSEGKLFAKLIEKNKIIAVGAIAPEFEQKNVKGKIVKLSDFRGKYVLVDFWASWCVPCRRENPNVVRAYNQFKNKNFTVVGVSLDDEQTKDAWLKAIADDHLTWTQVSDLKSWKNEVAQLYLVHSIPQNFLLNPEGKIIARNLRGDDLENKLKEILK